MIQEMVRITITPEWVGLLDFQSTLPEHFAAVSFAPDAQRCGARAPKLPAPLL